MATDRRAVRLGVLGLVGVVLFSLLGVRLWFIQTVQADDLQAAVNQTRVRTVRIAPERGRIFDAQGRILADNQRILILGVDWQLLKRSAQRAEIFSRLSGWVDVPVETLEKRWNNGQNGYSPFLPFPIKSDVDEETVAAILERVEDFPGVQVTEGWKRVYPYAPHAAHVVGYMGAIQEGKQAEEFTSAGYLLNERVGQFGVEGSMESLLHGKWGETQIEVDGANRPIRVLSEVPPTNGYDIQLTIDLQLQQYVESILETTSIARRLSSAPNRVLKGRTERQDPKLGPLVPYKSPASSAVVMNYQTGQVMAMASYPTFDNRWFEAGISQTKLLEIFNTKDEFGLKDDPDKSILLNRAVQGRYNLGSTFKPFTAYAAMETGLISPGYRYNDQGYYKLDRESADRASCDAGVIKCTYQNAVCNNGKACVYGSVNVADALAVSSDTFFYNLGEHIMLDNKKQPVLQEQLRNIGFGAKTGIELPFEFAGVVPDAAVKKEYALRGIITEGEGRGYYIADNVQLAIGQGLLSATPLQLTNGYATIANGGLVLQPTIIKTVFDPGVPDDARPGFVNIAAGSVHDARPPVIKRQIPMDPAQHDALVQGLTRVITGPGVSPARNDYKKTTGEHAFFDYHGIPLAGKTGTAQGFSSYSWNDSSVFAAFSKDPEHPYVMSAYMEKAGYGSQAALPVVKCTFLQLSDPTQLADVALSDPLDLNSTVAAPSMKMPSWPACWGGKEGNQVLYTTPAQVD